MIRKHIVLIALTISIILLLTAVSRYPGGTYQNKNSVGFDWKNNFISNLFEVKAINGSQNGSRIWACFGMFFYSLGGAAFFVNMSKKIPERGVSNMIKYAGVCTMPFTFLVITPLHDLMLTISSFLFWTCIICITVFIMKTRHQLLKIFCVICLLIFYFAVYLNATNNWAVLPVVHKANIISSMLLILCLEYFTKKVDFAHIKSKREKRYITNS